MKKRRLTDLFVVGAPFSADDGNGAVEVWLQKLSPLDHEAAVRKANAARAQTLIAIHQPESETYLDAYNEASQFGDEGLVSLLIAEELMKAGQVIEAELASADEWANDEYLQGLNDAWNDGLAERWVEDNDDPEATRVFAELKRFATLVDERVAVQRAALMRDWEGVPRVELLEKATVRQLEMRANETWLRVFYRCEVWFGTRYPDDHTRYYFADLDEVMRLPTPVLGNLIAAYRELGVEPVEGKDLPGTPGSSTSSAPSEPEATTEPSGPVAATT